MIFWYLFNYFVVKLLDYIEQFSKEEDVIDFSSSIDPLKISQRFLIDGL
jgi:hypothetical protein